ncbi:MAG TPA: hypothetical protein VF016_03540 [Nitrososphaera sp.]|jgi:hypothetical protein
MITIQIICTRKRSYLVVKLAFEDKKVPEHIKNCGVRKRENNNRIECMNGTLRERVKVQRGWKSYETPLSEGQRIAYNFVKPHMALEGQTPAQVAGLDVKGWKELLKGALTTTAAEQPKETTRE